MFSPVQKRIKLPIILITVGILLFGFVCVGLFTKTMQMSSMDTGTMSLQHEQPCCNLGISHYMDSWKNIVLVVPDKMRDTFMLLALGLALAFGYSWFSLRYCPHLPDPDTVRLRLYVKENPDVTLFSHLKLAFARGILNPKIY